MSITPGAAYRSVRRSHPWQVVVVEATAQHVGFRLVKTTGHHGRHVKRLPRAAFETGFRPASS